MDEQVVFRLPSDMKTRIRVQAKSECASTAVVIRKAINSYLSQNLSAKN